MFFYKGKCREGRRTDWDLVLAIRWKKTNYKFEVDRAQDKFSAEDEINFGTVGPRHGGSAAPAPPIRTHGVYGRSLQCSFTFLSSSKEEREKSESALRGEGFDNSMSRWIATNALSPVLEAGASNLPCLFALHLVSHIYSILDDAHRIEDVVMHFEVFLGLAFERYIFIYFSGLIVHSSQSCGWV